MDGISKTKKQKNILYNHLKIFYDHIIIAAIYRYRKNMTGIKVMTNPITLFASLICKTTPATHTKNQRSILASLVDPSPIPLKA